MAYTNDNTAFDMRAVHADYEAAPARERNLTVVEGPVGAPHPLPPWAVTLFKCICVAGAVALAVMSVKVVFVSLTFVLATQNSTLNASLEEARSVACDLEIEYAQRSGKDRVWANATQAYGMAVPEQTVTLDVLAGAQAPVVDGETE